MLEILLSTEQVSAVTWPWSPWHNIPIDHFVKKSSWQWNLQPIFNSSQLLQEAGSACIAWYQCKGIGATEKWSWPVNAKKLTKTGAQDTKQFFKAHDYQQVAVYLFYLNKQNNSVTKITGNNVVNINTKCMMWTVSLQIWCPCATNNNTTTCRGHGFIQAGVFFLMEDTDQITDLFFFFFNLSYTDLGIRGKKTCLQALMKDSTVSTRKFPWCNLPAFIHLPSDQWPPPG